MSTYPENPDDEPTKPFPVAGGGYRHSFVPPQAQNNYPRPAPEGGFAPPPQRPGAESRHAQPAPDSRYAQPAPDSRYAQPAPDNRYAQPAPESGFPPAESFAPPAQRPAAESGAYAVPEFVRDRRPAAVAVPPDGLERPRAKAREQWADTAKGVCIVLVVLWHVIMKHYLQITWHIPVPLPGLWGTLGELLLPMRMPVFFTISGMFALNAAMRPWSVVRRSRVAKFFYLYALWLLIHTTLLAPVPAFDTLHASTPLQLLEQLTITPTNLWYLYALAAYFVIAKLTIKVPVPIMLAAAFALNAVASAGWLAGPGNRGQLYQNLFFFLLGLRLKPHLEKLARREGWTLLAGAGAGFLALLLLMRLVDGQKWFGVWPVISTVAVVAGFAAAAKLAKVPRLGDGLAWLGKNTLPIYIIHMPLLGLWHLATLKASSNLGTPGQLVLALVEPVLLTAFLVWLCLTLHRGLQQTGAGWLFELPSFKKPVPAEKRETPPWQEAPTQPLRVGSWND